MGTVLDIKRHGIRFGSGTDRAQDSQAKPSERKGYQVALLVGSWSALAKMHPGAVVRLQDVVDELDRAMEFTDVLKVR